jgi:hypothetical protein
VHVVFIHLYVCLCYLYVCIHVGPTCLSLSFYCYVGTLCKLSKWSHVQLNWKSVDVSQLILHLQKLRPFNPHQWSLFAKWNQDIPIVDLALAGLIQPPFWITWITLIDSSWQSSSWVTALRVLVIIQRWVTRVNNGTVQETELLIRVLTMSLSQKWTSGPRLCTMNWERVELFYYHV